MWDFTPDEWLSQDISTPKLSSAIVNYEQSFGFAAYLRT
jgi:hypothetical protein